tara:strand:+ start:156 stop:455 length:300 start_codon:yes stop_codon:yes gene_type:complete
MADFEPSGNSFYVAYVDSKKDTYLGQFIIGSNPTASGGVRTQSNGYAANAVNTYTTLAAFNNELQSLGQTQLSYNPYTSQPPDTVCTVDLNGNCEESGE